MRIPFLIFIFCTAVPAAAIVALWVDARRDPGSVSILNVSYDPTRELWRAVNRDFRAKYEQSTGQRVNIRQSHGGSASQARAVIDGLQADVVTLALWNDTDVLRARGLVAENWATRLPFESIPYHSTIVFVVRKGNPQAIRDWPDLIRSGVEVITPNPKTSGNGKLSFIAAWGAVRERGGSDADALAFVNALYRHVPILDTGARGATTTFAQNLRGDVHLTWENEAMLEVRESKGGLEIVYPPISIRAEPPVALVDQVVDSRGSRQVAEAYLQNLFEPDTQELIAQHGFRPVRPETLARHSEAFPPLQLFRITAVADSWAAAQTRFFDAGGIFDAIYERKNTGN